MGFPVLIGIRPGASEDVSFFLNEVPGLYFNLGIVPRDQDLPKAAPNHAVINDKKPLLLPINATISGVLRVGASPCPSI